MDGEGGGYVNPRMAGLKGECVHAIYLYLFHLKQDLKVKIYLMYCPVLRLWSVCVLYNLP